MWGCTFTSLAGWGGWPGILGCLVLMPLAVYIVFRLVDSRRKNVDRKDSLAILQKRLAAGEISLDEFTTLKQYL